MRLRILAAVFALLAVTIGFAPAQDAPAPDPLAGIEIIDNSTPDGFDIHIKAPATPEFASRFGLGGLLSYLSSVALAKPSALKGGKGSGEPTVPTVPEITGITLSNASFPGGSADGTVVGQISVQMASGAFTGSLSLTGTDAASFDIVGSNLVTKGVLAAGSYSLNMVATQGGATGSPFAASKTITGDVVLTIAGIRLSNDTFVGGSANGTVVGAISVDMTGGAFTGSLSLTGTDAGRFAISGGNLVLNGTQDAGTYSVGIRATQTGASGSPFTSTKTVTGSPAPIALTGITLSNNSFIGGSADGTVVGTISVQATGGLFTGSLSLAGADSAKFSLSGNDLILNGTQAAGSYAVDIVATQDGATGSPLTVSETITGSAVVTITGVSLSNSSFVGGSADGTVVGAISVQTTGGLFSGTLSLAGTDADKFAISGNNLILNGSQAAGTYSVDVVATQAGAAGSPFSSTKTITGSVPLAITGITLSNSSFASNAPSGTVVGAISVQTTGGPFAGTLALSGTDAAKFSISGSNLVLNGMQAAGSYSVNIIATQSGALGSPFTSAKTITGNLLVTLTGVTLSNSLFAGGATDGTVVGTISVQTVGGPFTGSLSLTGTNASAFRISGSDLVLNGTQQQGAYSINIVASQAGAVGTPFSAPKTITGYPPPVVANADNKIVITDKSGSSRTNYPLQFGRPFVCGEIAHYPQVLINGTPATTQADVKNRCQDGSVKFAVIAVMIPSLSGNASATLTFQDQTSGNNTALSKSDMLDASYDFDATIQIANSSVGGNATLSARTMMQAGSCAPWTSGTVAQTMICEDNSASRPYDMGSSSWRSLHPQVIATFWPATHQVSVRYVGEISNSQALEAFTYDVTLKAGSASPATVYSKTAFPHSIGTRWTRRAWIGGTPNAQININHNIGYLAATKMIANYDPTAVVPQANITANYSRWQAASTGIGGAGLWMLDMSRTGYHPDIGPMPVWYIQALYSGDYRDREVMLGQADLAGGFHLQVREGDAAKKIDRAQTVPGLGKPTTVYARPSLWLFDTRATPTAADAITIRSAKNANGSLDLYSWQSWGPDNAHQPAPFAAPYIVTGDYFYLEGLQLWAAYASFMTNPGNGAIGRFGPYAVIYDGSQVRGEAWVLRTRAEAWVLSPDADPMRGIFASMLDDALAKWEGQRNITGTAYQNTFLWTTFHGYLGTTSDGWQGLGLPPLGWWGIGIYAVTDPTYYNTSVAASANAGWQQNFITIALGRTVEVGYAAAQPLFAWAGKNIIGQMADPAYNHRLVSQYNVPDTKKTPTGRQHFQSWGDAMTGWSSGMQTSTDIFNWPETGHEFYWDLARGATGISAGLTNGSTAWANFNAMIAAKTSETGQVPNWGLDPTWAIIPR